jgi:hypothetical protein
MNNLNLNFDLFDLSPYTLFYGMCGVCFLLLLALWKLYQRNEQLEEFEELYLSVYSMLDGQLKMVENIHQANGSLNETINRQTVEINYLQKEIKTERTERANLGFEIAKMQDELKAANDLNFHQKTLIGQLEKDLSEMTDDRNWWQQKAKDDMKQNGIFRNELNKTEDARLFLEKSNQALLTKYNAAQKEIKRLKAGKKEAADEGVDYTKWSDKQLLKKAHADYTLGVQFKSIFSDRGKTRIVKEFDWENENIKNELPTFEIEKSATNIRSIRNNNGMNTQDGCSNPVIYTDKRGWCPIIEPAKPEYEFEEKITEIKEGDRFLCIKRVVMSPDKEIGFIKGNVYVSNGDFCITDERRDEAHQVLPRGDSGIWANKHFKKIKQ